MNEREKLNNLIDTFRITESYNIGTILEKYNSGDYSAEQLLQHALIVLEKQIGLVDAMRKE